MLVAKHREEIGDGEDREIRRAVDASPSLRNKRDLSEAAFRSGSLTTGGTALADILPPVSRFAEDGTRDEMKRKVVARLGAFFDRYHGLGAHPQCDLSIPDPGTA